MAYCTRCGKQIEKGAICECSKSTTPIFNKEAAKDLVNRGRSRFASFKNFLGIGDPEINERTTYERGMNIIPDSIKPNEGEIPVKQYNIAVLRSLLTFERAEGRMQVTNKRVIFRATGRSIGGRTTLQHEYAVDEIAGIEARRDFRFDFLFLLIGLVTLGIAPIIVVKMKWWVKLVAIGFALLAIPLFENILYSPGLLIIFLPAIVLWFYCLIHFIFRPNLVISIKNKTGLGENGPVDIRRDSRNGFLGLFGGKKESTGFAEVMPTKETERAIRELGAIITDIQKLGDLGLQKWVEE